MKKILTIVLCTIFCFSTFVFTSCDSSDEQTAVNGRTTVAIISDTMTLADADRYTLTCEGKGTSQLGQAYSIDDYTGGEILITVHSHNVSEAYKDMFDNDESFTFAVGTVAPAVDNMILVFAELSIGDDECYLSVVQRMVLTDASGKVTIREKSDKFNLSENGSAKVHSVYESEVK